MMIRALALYGLIVFSGCSDSNNSSTVKTKSIEADITVYLNERLKESPDGSVLDSVRLIRIDTLTAAHQLYSKGGVYEDQFNVLKDEYKDHNKELEYNTSQARLIGGMSTQLFNYYKDEGNKHLDSMRAIADRMAILGRIADSIYALAKQADTVNIAFLEAVYLYQLTRADRTVLRDTGYRIMNTSYQLIRREDYLK